MISCGICKCLRGNGLACEWGAAASRESARHQGLYGPDPVGITGKIGCQVGPGAVRGESKRICATRGSEVGLSSQFAGAAESRI